MSLCLTGAGRDVAGWTFDTETLVDMPINLSEYENWRADGALAMSAPSSLFRCNEASGDLADSIGTRTLTKTGNATFGVDVIGWQTNGVNLSDNSATDWFSMTGENVSTTAVAAFGIFDINTWAASRMLMSLSAFAAGTAPEVSIDATGHVVAEMGANTATSTYTYSGVVAVFAVIRPGSSEFKVYVKALNGPLETLTPTWTAPSNAAGTFYLLSGFGNSSDARAMRLEYWTGTSAEIGASDVGDFFNRRGFGSLSWDYDATSNKPVPSSALQWSAFLRAMGLADVATPNYLWLMQEASGDLADSIGSATMTRFGAGGVAYATAVTGWTRVGWKNTISGADGFAASAITTGTTSYTMVVLSKTPTSPGTGDNTVAYLGGNVDLKDTAVLEYVDAAGAVDPRGVGVYALAIKYDRGNSSREAFWTSDKMTPAWADVSNNFFIGGAVGTSALDSQHVYGVGWATALTNTQIKRLIKALGYAATWTP